MADNKDEISEARWAGYQMAFVAGMALLGFSIWYGYNYFNSGANRGLTGDLNTPGPGTPTLPVENLPSGTLTPPLPATRIKIWIPYNKSYPILDTPLPGYDECAVITNPMYDDDGKMIEGPGTSYGGGGVLGDPNDFYDAQRVTIFDQNRIEIGTYYPDLWPNMLPEEKLKFEVVHEGYLACGVLEKSDQGKNNSNQFSNKKPSRTDSISSQLNLRVSKKNLINSSKFRMDKSVAVSTKNVRVYARYG